MAGTTITGSVAGTQVAVNASGGVQQGLAAQILSSAAQTSSVVFKTASGPLTGPTAIVSGNNSVISGATSVPSASILLTGQSNTYVNSGTGMSTVVAADNTSSTITNANPHGALVGITGAGPNVLRGMVGANQFITSANGQDLVFLQGTQNALTSGGADSVLVGGPSTVMAAPGSLDDIRMTSNAKLSFINASSGATVDSITGGANGSVVVAGTGNTSIMAGAGPESFYVDTSSGNVTLNANAQATDMLEFIKDADIGTSQTVVTNFTGGDALLLHGYAGYTVASVPGSPTGSVLSLSDGSKVTFTNATAATVTSAIKLH